MANLAAAPWQRLHGDLSPRPFKPPRHDIDELLGLVPVDFKKPYDVREVIARLVDDSDFLEFKQLYGGATVCGHATLEGHACALIGNNGPINPDGATKRRSSSSCAASRARRSCTCRTPPATWSAPRPSRPAWSSTARR
jgi:acetyl-CoA carboxylase carboxyltransferase component